MLNILIDMEQDNTELKKLERLPDVHIDCVSPSTIRRELPPDLIHKTHILLCTVPPINISLMENLGFIQISSSGYSQLFNLGLVERGVRACNARGVFDAPIGEWCMAMMVNLARDLRGMIRNQDTGLWDRSARFQKEIRGCRVGIWGYGSIGRETARLAKAMGMRTSVMVRKTPLAGLTNIYRLEGTGDPEGTLPDKIYVNGQEKEFLQDLDFLILSMPLTKNNEGCIGERELNYLPKHACILNPARGLLIQEGPLLDALRSNRIAGAALDTHYHNPMPPEHPLWSLPNVIMTPHISGSTMNPNFIRRVWEIFVENVRNLSAGKPLLNELTSAQLNGE